MEETTFVIKETILLLRRWVWLLILGPLLGAGFSLIVSTKIDPVYQSTAKVLITRTGQYQSSDITASLSDLQLTQTYLQLLTTKTVLDIASKQLGVEIEPKDVKVQVIRDTQIIAIEVENSNPRQAALIANSMVKVLIEQNELVQGNHYTSMEESLNTQKTEIEVEIQNLQRQIENATTQSLEKQKVWIEGQISTLQGEEISLQQEIAKLGTVNSPEERLLFDQKTIRLEQVKSLLSLYQENYNNLLMVYGNPAQNTSNITTNSQLTLLISTQTLYQQFYVTVLQDLESVRLARLQNTPNVVQIEPASAPKDPIRPLPWLNAILGGVAGFVFAAGIIFMRETLNDTLKTPEAVERTFGVPVLGFVSEMQNKENSTDQVYVVNQPNTPISEAFRSLRTNLEFASTQKPIRTILVTSPQPYEGKTTIAVNLAAIFGQTDKHVILLDADMRHPYMHHILGLSNETGISDLFYNDANVQTVGQTKVDLSHLMIITSGSLPPNPSELLGSEKMSQILNEIQASVDIVVIDSPSLLVADAQILASKVDAVLFVIQPGVTHTEAARISMEMFKRAGARVVGVVMNRIPRNRNYYYGSYKYFSPYTN